MDFPTCIHTSPDCKYIVAGLGQQHILRVFKHGKKDHTVLTDVPEKARSTADLVAAGFAATEKYKYLMTCYADTSLHLWSVKGELLQTLDTQKISNSHAAVSPSGQFVAVCGFSPDVKIYEVQAENGVVSAVKPAMVLGGHTAAMLHFAFSSDSSRVVSISKDGTWRLFNIDVRYKDREDPRLIGWAKFALLGATAKCAVSPDLRTVVVASGTMLQVFSAEGELLGEIEEAHTAPITALDVDAESLYIASASADKSVHIYYNKYGIEGKISFLGKELVKCDKASQKERIQSQIDEAKQMLLKM
eukprot:m.203456 g.203456  ORF g.203456 m.203456 type:complete len:303 (-) comp21977_c14_seq1:44-952(-)